jgi:hypothetical protein
VLSPISAAVVYGTVAAFAARQIVSTWRSPSWHADLAAALGVVPVLAAVLGIGPAFGAVAAVVVAAVVAGAAEPHAGFDGPGGRLAAVGILIQAAVPVAVAGVGMVLVRAESPEAAVILLGLVSAYEMGDYLVGSGASNPVEGPLAGGAALIVVGFPLAILLIQPFDVMGVWMLGVTALCCPIGQWLGSAVLPRPDADAPALRRMDSLLLLAPLWVIAAGAF